MRLGWWSLQERVLVLLMVPLSLKPRGLGDGERFGRMMSVCMWLLD